MCCEPLLRHWQSWNRFNNDILGGCAIWEFRCTFNLIVGIKCSYSTSWHHRNIIYSDCWLMQWRKTLLIGLWSNWLSSAILTLTVTSEWGWMIKLCWYWPITESLNSCLGRCCGRSRLFEDGLSRSFRWDTRTRSISRSRDTTNSRSCHTMMCALIDDEGVSEEINAQKCFYLQGFRYSFWGSKSAHPHCSWQDSIF